MKRLLIDPTHPKPPTRDHPHDQELPNTLPAAKEIKVHPTKSGGEDASIFFVGTATTIIEWRGIRLMTDPNFLHAGDHVHLGPGVTSTRLTNPALDLHSLPPIDAVLLSHYHADHFDQLVEASLRRDLPIITTPHARAHLAEGKEAGEAFTQVYALGFFESLVVDVGGGRGRGVSGLRAVPPTNGWMVELGVEREGGGFECGFRIYISGDTLMVDELKEIPERYKGQNIDLMLVHLGGTTIPSPSVPLLMVTMDAKQGLELVRLINPDLTIPIHYDDYDVMLSPLSDFMKAMEEAGLADKVVYLDRKDQYKFKVKEL
ncbi:MAG: hypothetical protein FRX48_08674 [Lasallia pustulata]|uniref:Metallo-beta-lactamase domain-containing protein n=1 Tax=Lasallia pustulata TaxID=136370 RepID=A0A5M8PDR1_9LECA|nr:MAG: hypothetical protein FRX48_08674 [Lasallia pustulata]